MKFMETNKLNQQHANVVLARDISKDGHKAYLGFETTLSAIAHINKQDEKHFYEVLIGYNNRKLYFDFDKKAEDGEPPDPNEFIEDMTEVLISAVDVLFDARLSSDDIIFTNSSTDNKASFHVIVPVFNTSVDNMKMLYTQVSKTLSHTNDIYKNADGSSCLDNNIYGRNQCFRALGSCKMGKDNVKTLLTSSFTETDTLVGIYDCDESEELHLIPRLQQAIDEKKQAQEDRKLNEISNDADTLMKIVMNLNQNRADEFSTWLKVCLALGHENAGLDVALEFSKRSSKYNALKTEELYNQGSQAGNTHGRPATIGSLLAMLKEDNPDVFYEIVSVNPANYGLTQDEIKDMIEKHNENEKIKPDEKQEEKLERWLSKPAYYFNRKVSDPRRILDKKDNKKIYNSKHMKPYPKLAKTMIVKAEKGTGKTYAIEQYIEKHDPEYCLFVSFRRSLSSEIIKRLSKYGFVNYQDIKGRIDAKHKRVIIQVESLQRMDWGKQADLLICDEIESIRTQFFSETCRQRNACITKYEMLLELDGSKQAIFMDADISENTVKHIKQTRGGKIHYIENTYKKIQSQFKEFYTTKPDKIFKKLSEALDKKEKLVIACNRSKEFMEGLRQEILKHYPEVKMQLFNSKTIKNEAVANELKNTDTWKKYDVLMYSPTISAGVSVEFNHFDKCFCYFVNNGKINAMRQMINRVRKFSTNEFYYCLQSFGGSSKPQNVETMERYITTNRFIEQPEFILSKEKYDGTKTYPYKNAGYWLWIYNETEKARDKSTFIYNFLREQYHAGIGNMQFIPDTEDETETKITNDGVKIESAKLQAFEYNMISQAEPITDQQKEDIQIRLQEEKNVSDAEIYSLKRRNLLDFYDLGERFFHQSFVETYGNKTMKTAYKNRKALEKGIKSLCEEESRIFNGLQTDMTNIQDDLKKKYVAMKLVIATEFIKICGFKHVYDDSTRTKNQIEKGIKKHNKVLTDKMTGICDILGRAKRRRPDTGKWTFKTQLEFMNSALTELLQLKIKQTGNRTGIYFIDGIDQFDFDPNSIMFRQLFDV